MAAATSGISVRAVFSDDTAKLDMPKKCGQVPRRHRKSLENIWQIAACATDVLSTLGPAPAAIFESHDNAPRGRSPANCGTTRTGTMDTGFGGLAVHNHHHGQERPQQHQIATRPAGLPIGRRPVIAGMLTTQAKLTSFRPGPRFGQCVHKIVRHPAKKNTFSAEPPRVYAPRRGQDLEEIENGLPSNFGFPVTVTENETSSSSR